MSAGRIGKVVCGIILISLFWMVAAQAQAQGNEWLGPYRLSSEAGKASDGSCVADLYGYVHCFWTETLFENQQVIVQYARFDGETWSSANDIYLTGGSINNLSPVIDQHGTMHLAWAEGLRGPAYYTYAPAHDALAAQKWAEPVQINVPARTLYLRVDSSNILHLLYLDQTVEPGVYYLRSADQGITWSEPHWLDPDILPDHIPDSLSFELDEIGGLHAVWYYGAIEQGDRPDWVRYIHSTDGGDSWAAPFTIDRYSEVDDHLLTAASPVMTVAGRTVHVIWAAGSLPYRHHRYSTDAGQTWSLPRRFFGELHGQAFDGLAIDGVGRVHFFSQIRYPVGIYHGYWDSDHWTPASLVYLIAQEDFTEGVNERIHAHGLNPVVRAGNQLVITFGDGPADPNRRLFAMYRTLADISPLEPVPTPAETSIPVPVSSTAANPTPTPEPTLPAAEPVFDASSTELVDSVTDPGEALRVALLPVILIIGSVFVMRLLSVGFRKEK